MTQEVMKPLTPEEHSHIGDIFIPYKPIDEYGIIATRTEINLPCYEYNPQTVVATNVPHYCVQHSPAGYEFGYVGSGPADFALNCVTALLLTLEYDGATIESTGYITKGFTFASALNVYQDFKFAFVAPMDQDAKNVIGYDDAVRWLLSKYEDLGHQLPTP